MVRVSVSLIDGELNAFLISCHLAGLVLFSVRTDGNQA